MLVDPAPRLTLPRSVLAALWLPHVRDLGSVTAAARAITGTDEPHVAVLGRAQLNLPALFAQWAPVRACAATCPAPGAPAGAPASVSAYAVEAGECLVVAARQGTWAAVPRVSAFGSAIEPGARVSWLVVEAPDAHRHLVAEVGTLTDARTGLARATHTATEALTRLDLARWRPEAAARVADLASSHLPDWPLPAQVAAERVELLARAARLLAIVDLAREADPGVTSWQSDQRLAALREVEQASRRAVAAATVYVEEERPATTAS